MDLLKNFHFQCRNVWKCGELTMFHVHVKCKRVIQCANYVWIVVGPQITQIQVLLICVTNERITCKFDVHCILISPRSHVSSSKENKKKKKRNCPNIFEPNVHVSLNLSFIVAETNFICTFIIPATIKSHCTSCFDKTII